MRRLGYVLCTVGAVIVFGLDFLPLELLLTSGSPYPYIRAVPIDGPAWTLVVGTISLVCGVGLLLFSAFPRKNGGDAI
jgi:hypothetical protein